MMDNRTMKDSKKSADDGYKDLYCAAVKGDSYRIAKFFESLKYDEAESLKRVNFQPHPLCTTLLHIAVDYGHVTCAKIFIDNGIDVNCPDKFGNIPLHLAAAKPYVDCVEQLIKYGADCRITDGWGHNSLRIAAMGGRNENLLVLLSDIRAKALVSVQGPPISDTILHIAARMGMVDCIKALVRLGSDVNLLNDEELSPLQLLCCSEKLDYDAKKEMVEFLVLEHNADIKNVLDRFVYDICDLNLKALLIAYGASIDIPHRLSVKSFFYRELFSQTFSNLLKYIVNFLPRLPFLHTFSRMDPTHDSRLGSYAVWPDPFIPNDMNFELAFVGKEMFIKMYKLSYHLPIIDPVVAWFSENESPYSEVFESRHQSAISFKKYVPLQQPFLDLVYERVTEQLEDLKDIHLERMDRVNQEQRDKIRLLKLEKLLWYHKIASNPRSLQHHCRFAIREQMRHPIVKFVRKLPLPPKLHAFLLFENERIDVI